MAEDAVIYKLLIIHWALDLAEWMKRDQLVLNKYLQIDYFLCQINLPYSFKDTFYALYFTPLYSKRP